MTRRNERGQVAVLVLGFVVLALSVVVAVINVTAVQLARTRLLDVADAAALDAADALVTASVYRHGVGRNVEVSDATVQRSAGRYLASLPLPEHVEGWSLEAGTGSPDGSSAAVRLVGQVRMPLANELLTALSGPLTISVESHARARVVPAPAEPVAAAPTLGR